MKILWFSNVDIAVDTMSGSGTWVMAMADALCKCNQNVEIMNISMSHINDVSQKFNGNIKQVKINKSVIDDSLIKFVKTKIAEFQPDILHVWGTESKWSSFPFDDICIPLIFDMQGIVSSVYENFYGGLTTKEILKCFRLKEFLSPFSSLPLNRRIYKKSSKNEFEIIQKLRYISVQSKWVEGYIKAINPNCIIFHTGIVLRPEFYKADKWKQNNNFIIFSTATMTTPLKGLHVLLKALTIVKKYYPDVRLRLAGTIQTGLRIGGYAKLLFRYIKEHELSKNIVFLGNLDTTELIQEYQNASLLVNPSSVESYSLVVAEAMYIGTPIVASYVGGMANLGKNDENILYFPKEDYVTCANKILSLLNDPDLMNQISGNSQKTSKVRHDLSCIATLQLEIYNNLKTKWV